MRDSGYETTSSNINQQRFLSSNVNISPDRQLITVNYYPTSIHPNSSLSSSNTVSRTLKTFSSTNSSGNVASTMMSPRLAEQEIIEV
jgi:hypothetical protein